MNEKYMKAAIKQAQIAFENGDVPVGTVIVKNNKIIARAHNRREETKDATDHAEIIAIRKACKKIGDWRLNDCIMYITLEPCSMCMGAIQQSRIAKVIYGASAAKDVLYQDIDVIDGILEEECIQLLKTFFQNQRNL